MEMSIVELLETKSMTKIFGYELSRVSPQDREDVKQNCILEILKALRKNDNIPAEKFPSYCHTIIKRTIVDYYRKNNRHVERYSFLVHYNDGADDEKGSTVDCFTAKSVDTGYEMVDLRTDYLHNRDAFSKSERRILDYMLFNEYAMGMTIKEITDFLQIHKANGSRAIKKLRQLCS